MHFTDVCYCHQMTTVDFFSLYLGVLHTPRNIRKTFEGLRTMLYFCSGRSSLEEPVLSNKCGALCGCPSSTFIRTDMRRGGEQDMEDIIHVACTLLTLKCPG